MIIDNLVSKVKKHPDFPKAGMVLVHNGVVREISRDGKSVSGLEITINHQTCEDLLHRYKSKPGIVDIQVEFAPEKKYLKVGEDVMLIVVDGDIRENVIETLTGLLNDIKQTVTTKKEYF